MSIKKDQSNTKTTLATNLLIILLYKMRLLLLVVLKMRTVMMVTLPVILMINSGSTLVAQSVDEVGEVRLVIGAVSLQSAVTGSKTLELGDKVFQGDQIETPATGYAVVTLIDETKFTIKPNSIFKFQAVNDQSGGKVLTELLKGGLKAITGTIGKKNPPGFKIDTPLGSIGIRGTNLDAQLCQGDQCSLLHEALGCPQQPPEETNGLLYVTVTQGTAFLDNCEDDPDINPGQVGVTDGTASACKVLNEVPCFMRETVWQRDQQNDQILKSLEVPVLQQLNENTQLCQGDPICIQCQGDPLCIQCQGDPDCYQCQGDPICLQCQGDPLCIQCQGDPLCVQCQGEPQCIQCQGDPLCIQCQGDLECVRCNGIPACINGEDRPDSNTDPCLINPVAPGCPMDPCILNPVAPGCPMDPCILNPMAPGCPMDPCVLNPVAPGCPMDPCILDPTSTGCPQDPCVLNPSMTGCPMDPCILDPTSPGCPNDPCILDPTSQGCPMDPCILDPTSQGCPMDPCVLDPNGMACICLINPQDPICNPPMCTTPGCRAECGPTPTLDCICAVEPNNPICL